MAKGGLTEDSRTRLSISKRGQMKWLNGKIPIERRSYLNEFFFPDKDSPFAIFKGHSLSVFHSIFIDIEFRVIYFFYKIIPLAKLQIHLCTLIHFPFH